MYPINPQGKELLLTSDACFATKQERLLRDGPLDPSLVSANWVAEKIFLENITDSEKHQYIAIHNLIDSPDDGMEELGNIKDRQKVTK